jgi:uncharacterized protein
MDRIQALELLHSKMQNVNLRKHCYATEAVMRSLAKHFSEDEDLWGVAGLLHDADYELTKNDTSKHVLTVISWLKEKGTDERIINAIHSHGWKFVDGCPEPVSKMDWSLYCCDELTGFIVGVALVKGRSLSNVDVAGVLKKFPEKKFCAGVNRDQIKLCEKKLGIETDKFIGLSILAMQGICKELVLC